MSGLLKVASRIMSEGGSDRIAYPSGAINALVRSEYLDTFGPYQKAFNLHHYMKMNKMREYRIERIDRSDVAVQKYTSCAFQDGAFLSSTVDNLKPTKSYIQASRCIDEDFESIWEETLDFKNSGAPEYDAIGTQRQNMFIENLLEDYTVAINRMNCIGNFHDKTSTLRQDITAEERSIWDKTTSEHKGSKRLAVDYATAKGYAWMQRTDLLKASDFSTDGSIYNESVTDLIEAFLYDNNKLKKLNKMVNGTIKTVRGQEVWPYIELSSALYNKAVKELNAESANPLSNDRLLNWEVVNGVRVIMYNGRVPIIPAEYVDGFDRYLNGDTHSITISTSKNVQFGGNWDAVSDEKEIYGFRPAVLISRGTNPSHTESYKKWNVLSTQLLMSTIVDPDLYTGAVIYVPR